MGKILPASGGIHDQRTWRILRDREADENDHGWR
jgi:hypothetical protein